MINDINCVLIISCYFFCWKVWIWSLRWNLGGKKCWCVSGKVNKSFDLIYKTRKLLYVYIINLLIWTCKIRHCSSVKKCHMNKWMFVIQKHFFDLFVGWLIDLVLVKFSKVNYVKFHGSRSIIVKKLRKLKYYVIVVIIPLTTHINI